MRASLADTALTRYAGRFVWLELDYDKPVNQPFIARRGVAYTPSLYVLDPADERATASHIGGLTPAELSRFLEAGELGYRRRGASPADAALARGEEALGRGQLAEAASADREALGLATPGWPERGRAVAALTWALWVGRESQACAETAAVEAPELPRGPVFASVVLAGFASANQGGSAAWAQAARAVLEPLAEQAATLPAALRDVRFQLYQQLMHASQMRGDTVTVARWGHRWLEEIEATRPASEDERSALDIARVDAASALDEPARVIPALAASERAMPGNYNASLRLAQMEAAARHYPAALAACRRALAHVTGPMGRAWILETEADARSGAGDTAGARRALERALVTARAIGIERNRESNLRRIQQALTELGGRTP